MYFTLLGCKQLSVKKVVFSVQHAISVFGGCLVMSTNLKWGMYNKHK